MTSSTFARADVRVAATTDPAVAHLVRKTLPGEVLVCDWSEVTSTTQSVTVRWPEQHDFYVEDDRYHPLLLTESVRQALALLTSSFHGVPLDHRLGMEQIRSSVDPTALEVTGEPVAVTLLITHRSTRFRRMGSMHATAHVEAFRSARHLGHADVTYSTHPPALYDRLRGRYANAQEAFARALPPGPPVPHDQVGRACARDVVLTPTGRAGQWGLRVDVNHEVLFDHAHDHIPGMVMLEAAAQATRAVLGRPVETVSFDSEFLRYLEFDQPCLIEAAVRVDDPRSGSLVAVTGSQGGRMVFTTTVTAVPARG